MENLVRSVRSNPLFVDIHHASACGFAEVIERLCMGKLADVYFFFCFLIVLLKSIYIAVYSVIRILLQFS